MVGIGTDWKIYVYNIGGSAAGTVVPLPPLGGAGTGPVISVLNYDKTDFGVQKDHKLYKWINDKWNLALSFIPGVYDAGNDENLGGWLMFRSGIELGYSISEDWRVSLAYDHRSSGDLWVYNPGMETLQIKIGRLLRAN